MKERAKTGVVYGALAFDARVADAGRERRLDAVEADALAAAIRRNLIADCPDARGLRLIMGAAYYDACDVLRIGWPLHRRLRALPAEARSHRAATVGDGGLPEPLGRADARALHILPFVLDGNADAAIETSRHLDRNRMLPYTPRARNPAFDLPTLPAFDAVGYLSLRSLSTELAGRYYSDGLGGVWSLIERVLFAPKREHEWHEAPKPEREAAPIDSSRASLRYADGRVRICDDGHERARRWRALLTAHGLAVDALEPSAARMDAIAPA